MAGKSLSEAQAIRYLIDALNDEAVAELALEKKIFEQAIFHSEQLCEKAAKACLALLGIVISDEHRFIDFVEKMLIPNSGKLKKSFSRLLPKIGLLEGFYIPSRYGVDKTGRVHLQENYNETEITELFNHAQEFLTLCFSLIEGKISLKLPHKKEDLINLLKNNYQEYIKLK